MCRVCVDTVAAGFYVCITTGGPASGDFSSEAAIMAGFQAVPLVYKMLNEASPNPLPPQPPSPDDFVGVVMPARYLSCARACVVHVQSAAR